MASKEDPPPDGDIERRETGRDKKKQKKRTTPANGNAINEKRRPSTVGWLSWVEFEEEKKDVEESISRNDKWVDGSQIDAFQVRHHGRIRRCQPFQLYGDRPIRAAIINESRNSAAHSRDKYLRHGRPWQMHHLK